MVNAYSTVHCCWPLANNIQLQQKDILTKRLPTELAGKLLLSVMSVCPFVFALTSGVVSCTCMGHDRSSPMIHSQGHGLWLKLGLGLARMVTRSV